MYCSGNPALNTDLEGLKASGVVYKLGDGYASDIANIQLRLNYLGFRDFSYQLLKADGYFRVTTEQAVKKFQAAKGLTVDGKVGDATWLKLGFDFSGGTPTTSSSSATNPNSGGTSSNGSHGTVNPGGKPTLLGSYENCNECKILIKNALNYLKYGNFTLTATIDSSVEAAILWAQQDYNLRHCYGNPGIAEDGLPGPQTWNALQLALTNNEYAIPRSAPATSTPPPPPAPAPAPTPPSKIPLNITLPVQTTYIGAYADPYIALAQFVELFNASNTGYILSVTSSTISIMDKNNQTVGSYTLLTTMFNGLYFVGVTCLYNAFAQLGFDLNMTTVAFDRSGDNANNGVVDANNYMASFFKSNMTTYTLPNKNSLSAIIKNEWNSYLYQVDLFNDRFNTVLDLIFGVIDGELSGELGEAIGTVFPDDGINITASLDSLIHEHTKQMNDDCGVLIHSIAVYDVRFFQGYEFYIEWDYAATQFVQTFDKQGVKDPSPYAQVATPTYSNAYLSRISEILAQNTVNNSKRTNYSIQVDALATKILGDARKAAMQHYTELRIGTYYNDKFAPGDDAFIKVLSSETTKRGLTVYYNPFSPFTNP